MPPAGLFVTLPTPGADRETDGDAAAAAVMGVVSRGGSNNAMRALPQPPPLYAPPQPRAVRRSNAQAPIALLPPPRLPSLSPVTSSAAMNARDAGHAATGALGVNSGAAVTSSSSLLPPGCFPGRPTAVYSAAPLPRAAVAAPPLLLLRPLQPVAPPTPLMNVIQLSPPSTPHASPSSGNNNNGGDGVTYIGMSPNASADREKGRRQQQQQQPMRRDQKWNDLALAAEGGDDHFGGVRDGGGGRARGAAGVSQRSHSPTSPPAAPAGTKGYTYRRGAPYNIISNLP